MDFKSEPACFEGLFPVSILGRQILGGKFWYPKLVTVYWKMILQYWVIQYLLEMLLDVQLSPMDLDSLGCTFRCSTHELNYHSNTLPHLPKISEPKLSLICVSDRVYMSVV